jgi:hypothetical protein
MQYLAVQVGRVCLVGVEGDYRASLSDLKTKDLYRGFLLVNHPQVMITGYKP